MKTVISFREGHSGHYLKSVILNSNLAGVQFRMPQSYPANDITLTHVNNYDQHQSEFDLVLRILPKQHIYSAAYNNFMKKLIAEEYSSTALDNWLDDPVYWHDRCYYNIVEYYGLITEDIQNNTYPNIIDFDRLLDLEYLRSILLQYFQIELDPSREQICKTYRDLQLNIDLDQHITAMADIVDVISSDCLAKNPWFFSYCIHKYERANNLSPENRLWSVNNINQVPTKQLLLTLANQYN